MRRAGLVVTSAVLVLASLGGAGVLLSVQTGQAFQIRVRSAALTPETAVRTMLNNRGTIAAAHQVNIRQHASIAQLQVSRAA
jgi:hypothetical protein